MELFQRRGRKQMYGFQISTLSDRQADKGLMFGAVKVNMNEEDINLTSQDESFHRILDATDNLWRSKHVTLNAQNISLDNL